MMSRKFQWLCLTLLGVVAITALPALAEQPPPAAAAKAQPVAATQADITQVNVAINTVWIVVAAALVFFMQAGFGMVEAGFLRAKNTCNILMKNFVDYCSASLMFYVVGYSLMFGGGNGFLGWEGFGIDWAAGTDPSGAGVSHHAYWFFQAAFCGAAATIVAGGMAGRMKFGAYLMYTVVISALIYPIVGHWIWGGGWLAKMDFSDFAGSTVVHATGGIAALIGTILLGARHGKYNGKAKAIPGHNIPIASLGVFILWFGWFGFNAGSQIAVGNGMTVAKIAMNTNIAACCGALAAMLTIWKIGGKPDLSMTMNGALAGLVAITAGCDCMSSVGAMITGTVGGVAVVLSALLLERLRIDDPVGAFPVHGINGIWGTLAIGLFSESSGLFYGHGASQLGIQALGVFSVVGFVLLTMGAVFLLIKKTYGLRVSKQEELRGLDIGEHGMESYAGFQIFTTE
ncbi:MAG: ammonium transporter [Phycisphaerales bacterium]|jgi:ammonium transporter, Amt family|nr:ammonium transporter [Phycisphaerales bacterium]MBT7170264.1 ammonium transporter [Phycisphaerales bacterium]